MHFVALHYIFRRSQWPRGLRRRSTAARLLRSWVRIPPGAWMFVCCECRVSWGRGLCYELITRPEESYWLWSVIVWDLETSWMRRPWPTGGLSCQRQTDRHYIIYDICWGWPLWLLTPGTKNLTNALGATPLFCLRNRFSSRMHSFFWNKTVASPEV